MPKVGLFNKEGQQVGDIQLNEQVFGVEVNKYALHQVVVAQLANKRQGTQSAKTRSEVRGGGIKPWRQKEQVEQDKVLSERLNGSKVELYLHQNQEITECQYQRA